MGRALFCPEILIMGTQEATEFVHLISNNCWHLVYKHFEINDQYCKTFKKNDPSLNISLLPHDYHTIDWLSWLSYEQPNNDWVPNNIRKILIFYKFKNNIP